MYTTLAEVSVEDLERFVAIFATRGADLRRKHGSRRAEILSAVEDGDRAFVLIDWPNRASFDAFRADPEVPGTMRLGSLKAPPKFMPVERIATFPA